MCIVHCLQSYCGACWQMFAKRLLLKWTTLLFLVNLRFQGGVKFKDLCSKFYQTRKHLSWSRRQPDESWTTDICFSENYRFQVRKCNEFYFQSYQQPTKLKSRHDSTIRIKKQLLLIDERHRRRSSQVELWPELGSDTPGDRQPALGGTQGCRGLGPPLLKHHHHSTWLSGEWYRQLAGTTCLRWVVLCTQQIQKVPAWEMRHVLPYRL